MSYFPIFLICVFFLFFSLGKGTYRELVWLNSSNQSLQSKMISFISVYKDIIKNGKNDFKTNHLCKETSITADQDVYCKRFIDYQLERRVFHSFESL